MVDDCDRGELHVYKSCHTFVHELGIKLMCSVYWDSLYLLAQWTSVNAEAEVSALSLMWVRAEPDVGQSWASPTARNPTILMSALSVHLTSSLFFFFHSESRYGVWMRLLLVIWQTVFHHVFFKLGYCQLVLTVSGLTHSGFHTYEFTLYGWRYVKIPKPK